ncbi:outer membrane beta-barrel protein [Cardinium endosymbiont of Tipula unca]|uniref:outer membrane beta-barrel protein n=1 Tax=Cardinium endosymbiont of Tipula unca TaxID=3066216 RepID=UPI0030D17BA6
MKVIKKTLVAGVLACSALNAQAEVDALSYGIKAAYSASYLSANQGAKFKGDKEMSAKLLGNQFIAGSLYVEYAFNDYIGLGLEAGYMKQGGVLKEKAAENKATTTSPETSSASTDTATKVKEDSIEITTNGIIVPLSLYVYPLGREEGEGIFKLAFGLSAYVPVGDPDLKQIKNGTDAQIDVSKVLADTDKKKQLPGFDFAIHAGMAWEFPVGLSMEARGSFGLMNRFDLEKDKTQTVFDDITDLKVLKNNYFSFSLGYNLATLFCD